MDNETATLTMSDRSDPSAAMFHESTSGSVRESEFINSGRDTTYSVHNNYNIGVFHDVIGFAALIYMNQSTGADSKELDEVEISSIMPPDPSSLPVSSIADRYTRSMLECMVGYPLYEPRPFGQLSKEEYSRHGVNVGDVGFIRNDGTFDFLFNICPPRNGLINPPNLPDGFSLETPKQSEIRNISPLPCETCFFPRTVETASGEYICKGPVGAILVLPEGGIQDEAIDIGWFEDLAKLHGVEWYKYTMSRGRSISNVSLYLITSFTKCAQWGIGVFDRPCDPGQGLRFVSSPFGWKGSSGAAITKVADPKQGDTANQCVFLRGYKIMIRQDIFDKLPTRQLATRIRGGGGTGFSSRIKKILSPLARITMSTVTKSDYVVLHADFNSSPVRAALCC
ncbi:hypothetical protein M378DRAFT_346021 [Amanita muscaria Koide BX008]|uniref:Uncharacterized protein n=1 Tax=Amanita muscaria (strain Koide BX008) TaxID=946122 RepID=A0A0C2WMW0_AMAMK|nr:hypothetical protein M378DRAFT_346021 [Amanita muscaria Koide BX008]